MSIIILQYYLQTMSAILTLFSLGEIVHQFLRFRRLLLDFLLELPQCSFQNDLVLLEYSDAIIQLINDTVSRLHHFRNRRVVLLK